jgi:chemotaxis protein CheX
MPTKPLSAKRARRVRGPNATQAVESPPALAAAACSDRVTQDRIDRTVRLPKILDLAAAAPLARELLARRGKPAVIDAMGIERPGASCVQVLLAAVRTWDEDALPLSFVNCGPPLVEHLRVLGIEPNALLKGDQS